MMTEYYDNKYLSHPEKMILTAGPSITNKEIDYVMDAIRNGHGEHWGDYIKRFEVEFAKYIGVKYALATSSCTGALHLALRALGIGQGDEVIVPDCSWIATASAVCYTGATPVFADVDNVTWCIDPVSIEKKITSRTKAIVPVHLYGNIADMANVKILAEKYNLKIVEDAAPSLGAEMYWKRTGSFGDVACFSFQGAKILSTGEGGMLVTNDKEVFDKVKHYAEHGRSGVGFHISEIGFKYKMSNLQAAMGLAQLERVDELLAKKKQIFDWYWEGLKDVAGITMNRLTTAVYKPNYWMTSIVLEDDFDVSRDGVMHQLKNRNVDTRPFFPLISSFNMFTTVNDNWGAEHISRSGINLPSKHDLTYDDVIYIVKCIKDILNQ